jgi:iron complex outermembrane recepter protein
MRTILLTTALVLLGLLAQAQTRMVTGIVTDLSDGSPMAGVNVVAKGTQLGTSTNSDGRFSLEVPTDVRILVFSFIGFPTIEKTIPASNNLIVEMESSASELEEVVITVGRGSQRTIVDTPLPVDNITSMELESTGQFTFDKALQYRVPSFNSVNTPVNDATTLLDPYEIRNLGPSRTLILINGKRKNLSSLLYVQFSPGRGETGADISGIPMEAIKRVEILRDGASAQYGSDAIAGVMNVILKDRYEYSTLNVTSGVTHKGDGGSYGLTLNSGSNFGQKGFINYSVGFNQQNNAIRSGIVDLPTEIAIFGNPDESPNHPDNFYITEYLQRYPTANNLNGTGETSSARFSYNFGLPVGNTAQLYSNAAYVSKKVVSNANFRTPYWLPDLGLLHTPDPSKPNYMQDQDPLYDGYIGYMPTFEGDMSDYHATLGVKNNLDGWMVDASLTIGGNKQLYTVDNTLNHDMELDMENSPTSPISFKPGGYAFHHVVGNLDFGKQVTDKIYFAFGSEARSESFEIIAGDEASYFEGGANSFPGIRSEIAAINHRFNFGAYADLTYDINENFLLSGAIRGERYSDFGEAFVWKASSRYKLADDKVVLRGSISTGFRAPTLHQIYAQSIQASFVEGTVQNSGLFNNLSKEARALGIPRLKPEKSTNYTVGTGLNLSNNFSITLDYYNIRIKDRIVMSSTISSDDENSTLGQILEASNVVSIQFFINGIETQTQGLDFVAHYRNIPIGPGMAGVNFAGNYMLSNKIIGSPADPEPIATEGQSILNTQIRSLLTESRPWYKLILGVDYNWGNFSANLNNTLFGPTAFRDLENGGSDMENIEQRFEPKIVTDLNIGYKFSDKLSASFTVNNLFNVLPEWKLRALNPAGQAVLNDAEQHNLIRGFLSFSGRYPILAYNGAHFSQLGTIFMGQLTYRF